jgi:DNA topoisomerase-3
MKLVIAEKPSVAQSIAKVLGAADREDGCLVGNGYIVSWCFGHLVELASADAYDPRYAKWVLNDLPIIPKNWKYVVSANKGKQLKILSGLMSDKRVDGLVCATDAGREGELIFRLVVQHCGCRKPVERLWISSMEDSAIKAGFQQLKDDAEYDRLYGAALCRARADWIVGINATRLFSVLYHTTLNVGRVQSPTLAMLVQREAEIAAFRKMPFYTVELDCGNFTASGERLADKKDAEEIRMACDGTTVTVKSVIRQEKSAQPPKLYDLTTLQRDANRILGYTAQQTLDYTQSLYEKKLATYPRTDSKYLTDDMQDTLPELVKTVSTSFPFAENPPVHAERIIDSSKVSDHHAIILTRTLAGAGLSGLPIGETSILNLIAARLLCAVGDPCVTAETTVTLDCNGHAFTAKGKTVTALGWKETERRFFAALKRKPEDKPGTTLPELSEGQTFENVRATVKEGFTSPPETFHGRHSPFRNGKCGCGGIRGDSRRGAQRSGYPGHACGHHRKDRQNGFRRT